MSIRNLRGAYPADRAAALSGVPRSTIHSWDRKGVLHPGVSAHRVKLWSYSDLMSLRTIDWLRHRKSSAPGPEIPASSMPAIHRALKALAELDLAAWSQEGGPSVVVDAAGRILIPAHDPGFMADTRQTVMEGSLDLTGPFDSGLAHGPDLRAPRPRLRIIPEKLGGAPHLAGSRVETEALAALHERGMSPAQIGRLYPELAADGIDQALDLEGELRRGLRVTA